MRVISKFSMLLATTALLGLGACTGQGDALKSDASHSEMAPAPMMGLKNDVYLSGELQESVARLNGLETTLGRLQSDLQGTSTAMMRIESMRQEIDGLNIRFRALQARLQAANGGIMDPALMAPPLMTPPGTTTTVTTVTTDIPAQPTPLMGEMAEPNAAPVAVPAIAPAEVQVSKPVVEEKKPEPKKEEPKAQADVKDGVNDVRLGVHDKSVRIVLDVGGKETGFTTDLDSANKLLTVDLPKTKWSAQTNAAIKNNPLIASYAAQPSGEGSVVVFSLKADTKIVSSSTMKAGGGKPARIVIDLAK